MEKSKGKSSCSRVNAQEIGDWRSQRRETLGSRQRRWNENSRKSRKSYKKIKKKSEEVSLVTEPKSKNQYKDIVK